jgi:endonuclease YncB( thermonuclease family)
MRRSTRGFALCGLLLVGAATALADSSAGGASPAPPASSTEAVPGAELRGRVVGVTDGDTLTVLVAGRPQRIRLAQIDAPESRQPFGAAAKRALSELAFGREVRVVVVDRDRYGRIVGEIFCGGRHVNQELVRSGHAWAYTEYARSTEIIEIENEARAARRGLWALPEAQREAPWSWRARARAEHRAPSVRPPTAKTPIRDCALPRSCREMTSCEEARFHFEQCGWTRLDGDGDGVPCEKLCPGG